MKRLFGIILILVLLGGSASAQRGNIWCFGDSAALDFSGGTPVSSASSVVSRGSCVSISDTSGDLLFYTFTRAGIAGNSGRVFNKNNLLMTNGDSILGQGWYQEMVIVPDPAADSVFYLFSIGVTNSSAPGLYYSKVSFSNSSLNGIVTQKNIQLQSFNMVDCINAVKHGNGRDWWVIFRKSDFPSGSNSDFYTYLVTPNGIQNVSIQTIGTLNRTNLGHIAFSSDGSRMVFTNLLGTIELFDFNRCDGLLSNKITIGSDPGFPPFDRLWSSEFSPDGSKLYVSTNADTSYIFQYDLNAPNISSSKDTIWSTSYPINTCGALKLAPDNKIYLSNVYYTPSVLYYPYADSMYNSYNMNLSVINQPDSLGSLCDFQPYSFNLGGKRTYLGLPNNPDYDLPALAGSSCDTLVGIGDAPQIQQAALNAFYHSAWEKAFINASNLKGKNGKLLVYDMQGKITHQEPLRIQNGYYTRDLSMQGKAHGVYLVIIQTEKERLARKISTD
jgi:hypothetical protein